MSFTYGFYNSLNHDRVYDATVIGQLFDGMIMDGVYSAIGDKFIVHASGQGMRVNVGSGRAWFNHTWNFNDTNLPIEPEQSEVILDRIDALVLDINTTVEYRENQIMFVKGTPSSNPVRPTLIHEDGHYQYPLAYILIPASSTEVLEANITNMVGTDECPFATGLLQQVSTSELIEQWGAEWRLWSDTQKAAFISWMNSEEAAYDTWSDTQKAAFTLWMTEEKDEFDEWFAHIQDILDEDVAAHLQNEIDEIMRDGMLGSIFRITTSDTELYGMRVTVTNGTVSKYADFDSSGVAEIKSYEEIGTLHFSSTDGHRTAHYDLTVPYYGVYDVPLNFWAATVNISTTSSVLFGKTITVEKDGESAGTAVFSAGGSAVYTATGAGLYSFSVSYEEGGETRTVTETLNITEETTYSIIFSVGFDYLSWLNAGGVSGTYASLDDVLSDEKAVRQLMTVHASVDYLASFNTDDTSVIAILNNDYAAKWITCTAYAEDVLTDAYGALMESIGKYGYGKWVLQGQVPVMTSNTAPYGEAFSSTPHSSSAAWQAFSPSTTFTGMPSSTGTGEYVGYYHVSPVSAKKISAAVSGYRGFTNANIVVQGSIDGSEWVDITEPETISSPAAPNQTVNYLDFTITDDNAYPYHRIIRKTNIKVGSDYDYFYVAAFQLYDYAPLGNVPIMTSNTAPYGEASATTTYGGNNLPFRAFDDSAYSYVANSTATGQRLVYKFTTPSKIRRALLTVTRTSFTANVTFKVQGSNDGTTWVDESASLTAPTTADTPSTYEVGITDNYYLYGCLYFETSIYTSGSAYMGFKRVQFYGRQMNVSVPKMDSNASPYGECMIVNEYPANTGHAYYAFDGAWSNSHYAQIANTTNSNIGLVGYKFPSKVLPNAVITMGDNVTANRAGTLNYSDDGITWVDTGISVRLELSAKSITFITGQTEHQYWGVHFDTGYYVSSHSRYVVGIAVLNFFGFDYSEKEWDTEHPRKYIYDNGVELEEIEQVTAANGWTPISSGSLAENSQKLPNGLYIAPTASNKQDGFGSKNAVDFSGYSLFRFVADPTSANAATSYSLVFTFNSAKSIAASGRIAMLTFNGSYEGGLDISSISQDIYTAVWSDGATTRYGYVYAMWLE